ncbi:MAG TPA: hypothetical protein VNA28_11860 [Solirubrobacteraceae bacterium]|nr:hypothetical protein [Solirubrobacteraceae bacterium]
MRIQLKRSPVFVAACGAVAASAAFGAPAAHAQSITNVIYTSQDAAPAGPAARKACDAADSTTNCHIFAVNLDGAGGPITSGPANDVDPAASPDGTKIAFARRVGPVESGNYDIYVMSANGTGITQLTSGPRDERYPAWSPDGSRIAYRGYPVPVANCAALPIPDCDPGSQIFTMSAAGPGNSGTAIRNTAGGDQPAWSPDGTEIAYSARQVADPAAGEDIFKQVVDNAAGAAPTRLTSTPQNDRYPSWQPTAGSTQVLFRRLDAATGRELWLVDSSNGVSQALLAPATNNIGRAASWAPLNLGAPNVLAFVSYADASKPVEGDQEIWLGNLSGNTIGNLPGVSAPLTNNDQNDDEPRISHVPAALSPVTRPTGVAAGGGGAGGGGGVVSSLPLTVGGGTTADGRRALALTLTVPRQNLGRKKKTVRASVKCSAKCAVTMTGFTKLRVRGKIRTLRLQRTNKSLNAGVNTRVNIRLPLATLRSVRSALRRKKRVTITIQATARTSSGEFTPTAKRKLVLRR